MALSGSAGIEEVVRAYEGEDAEVLAETQADRQNARGSIGLRRCGNPSRSDGRVAGCADRLHSGYRTT